VGSDRRKEASIRGGVVVGTRVGDPFGANKCHPHGAECQRWRLSGSSKDAGGSRAKSTVESGARWRRSDGVRRGSPGSYGAQ
jgi:hypothetical protein